MLNIVFGSSKVGRSTTGTQEFTVPSIKLEASRGAGTSRRILFNKSAMTMLELETGAVQELLFGFAHDEENSRLFLINTAEFSREVEQKTYKTSKNRVSYTDSKEKGKGISSTPLASELRSFLNVYGLEETQDLNLSLSIYDESGEAIIYELTPMSNDVEVAATTEETVVVVENTTDGIISEDNVNSSTEVMSAEAIVDTIEDINLDSNEYNEVAPTTSFSI
jgi:hypothetical protein